MQVLTQQATQREAAEKFGLVPPRVDAPVKAGLLEPVDHASGEGGWSLRRSAAAPWASTMRGAACALLSWEKAAICKLAGECGEIDRSQRKLAHRGSWLGLVHASESTVLRVLTAPVSTCLAPGRREPRQARPWPQWAEPAPG